MSFNTPSTAVFLVLLMHSLQRGAVLGATAGGCSESPVLCCHGRNDTCRRGNVCYCDEYCSTKKISDCCSDYNATCHTAITTLAHTTSGTTAGLTPTPPIDISAAAPTESTTPNTNVTGGTSTTAGGPTGGQSGGSLNNEATSVVPLTPTQVKGGPTSHGVTMSSDTNNNTRTTAVVGGAAATATSTNSTKVSMFPDTTTTRKEEFSTATQKPLARSTTITGSRPTTEAQSDLGTTRSSSLPPGLQTRIGVTTVVSQSNYATRVSPHIPGGKTSRAAGSTAMRQSQQTHYNTPGTTVTTVGTLDTSSETIIRNQTSELDGPETTEGAASLSKLQSTTATSGTNTVAESSSDYTVNIEAFNTTRGLLITGEPTIPPGLGPLLTSKSSTSNTHITEGLPTSNNLIRIGTERVTSAAPATGAVGPMNSTISLNISGRTYVNPTEQTSLENAISSKALITTTAKHITNTAAEINPSSLVPLLTSDSTPTIPYNTAKGMSTKQTMITTAQLSSSAGLVTGETSEGITARTITTTNPQHIITKIFQTNGDPEIGTSMAKITTSFAQTRPDVRDTPADPSMASENITSAFTEMSSENTATCQTFQSTTRRPNNPTAFTQIGSKNPVTSRTFPFTTTGPNNPTALTQTGSENPDTSRTLPISITELNNTTAFTQTGSENPVTSRTFPISTTEPNNPTAFIQPDSENPVTNRTFTITTTGPNNPTAFTQTASENPVTSRTFPITTTGPNNPTAFTQTGSENLVTSRTFPITTTGPNNPTSFTQTGSENPVTSRTFTITTTGPNNPTAFTQTGSENPVTSRTFPIPTTGPNNPTAFTQAGSENPVTSRTFPITTTGPNNPTAFTQTGSENPVTSQTFPITTTGPNNPTAFKQTGSENPVTSRTFPITTTGPNNPTAFTQTDSENPVTSRTFPITTTGPNNPTAFTQTGSETPVTSRTFPITTTGSNHTTAFTQTGSENPVTSRTFPITTTGPNNPTAFTQTGSENPVTSRTFPITTTGPKNTSAFMQMSSKSLVTVETFQITSAKAKSTNIFKKMSPENQATSRKAQNQGATSTSIGYVPIGNATVETRSINPMTQTQSRASTGNDKDPTSRNSTGKTSNAADPGAGKARLFVSLGISTSLNPADTAVREKIIQELNDLLKTQFSGSNMTVTWKGAQVEKTRR
ncbi:uncharacterized protein [Ambystoma mexicanum]|uniref:uncharacterized protein n=1 Tax=Ambystoma mexicanum TaxID=8296 RepID=UPI0037E85118